MPRGKMFDVDLKIDDAMQLFWERGYEGTGMQAVVDTLGVSRGSLYATYGDKDDLWCAALERYCSQMTTYLHATLVASDLTLVQRLEAVLTDVVDPPTSRPCGCLLTRAITERMDDPRTAEIVRSQLRHARQSFVDALRSAQGPDRLRDDANIDDLADFLLTTLEGLYVLDSLGSASEAMRASVRVAISVIAANAA